MNFACVRRNNWEFSSNLFSLKITKVSKVFINNMFLGIEIYYINILFGLFDTLGRIICICFDLFSGSLHTAGNWLQYMMGSFIV